MDDQELEELRDINQEYRAILEKNGYGFNPSFESNVDLFQKVQFLQGNKLNFDQAAYLLLKSMIDKFQLLDS